MNRLELMDLIQNGENSGLEFKRDDIIPEKLGKEMVALLNLEGGHILLGVEDDGTVTGLTRDRERVEEWVMEAARAQVRPAFIPYWETIEWEPGKFVGVISLSHDAPDKPYKAKRASAWVTIVRVGTTSRDATDDEEARLYHQSGRIQYDRRPALGATFVDLDHRRIRNYFQSFRRQSVPTTSDETAWSTLLVNTELMTQDRDRAVPSVGGLVLFGVRPNKHVPQAGITAVAYQGIVKDYDARERALLRGPAVGLFDEAGELLDAGLIEQALDFVRRNTGVEAWVNEGGQRHDRPHYSSDAVREAVINAIAHRDYSITVTDIELSIYQDRMEVISPGRLPNTVTVVKMRAGYRASRNELIKEVLRDYRYIEATGLGVPRKIVEGMLVHNGTAADLVEEDDRFIVRLWKKKAAVDVATTEPITAAPHQ